MFGSAISKVDECEAFAFVEVSTGSDKEPSSASCTAETAAVDASQSRNAMAELIIDIVAEACSSDGLSYSSGELNAVVRTPAWRLCSSDHFVISIVGSVTWK